MIRKKHITLCFSLFLALSMVLGQLIPIAATDTNTEVATTEEQTNKPEPAAEEVPEPEEAGEEPGVVPIPDTNPIADDGAGEPEPGEDEQGDGTDSGEVTEPTTKNGESVTDQFAKVSKIKPVGSVQIVASYDWTSGLSKDAQLNVREITEDSEEYNSYLNRAKAVTVGENTFAHFYDIWFTENGVKTQPTGKVNVEFNYLTPQSKDSTDSIIAVHFGENEQAEIIEPKGVDQTETKVNSVELEATSFSVYGVMALASDVEPNGTLNLNIACIGTLKGTSGYSSWKSSNESVATVTDNGSTATVLGLKQGNATITHTYYEGWDKKTETFTVVVSNLTPVYVYVAAKDADDNLFSQEMLDLLNVTSGVNKSGYYAAGTVLLDLSKFQGNYSSMISSNADWDTLIKQMTSGNFDTSNSNNPGNHTDTYFPYLERDISAKQGNQKSGLWVSSQSKTSGIPTDVGGGNKYIGGSVNEQGVPLDPTQLKTGTEHFTWHLDMRFQTVKINYIYGNNDIKTGECKDGNSAGSKVFIKGVKMDKTPDLGELPQGYRVAGYYLTPDFEPETEWNGLNQPILSDTTVYIQIVPKTNVVINYIVKEGKGNVTDPSNNNSEAQKGMDSFNPFISPAESPKGSTAKPDDDWKFDGWYSDENCQTKVSENSYFNPSTLKSDWTEGATYTYYAKFVTKTKTIKITNSVTGNAADTSKEFVYHLEIKNGDKAFTDDIKTTDGKIIKYDPGKQAHVFTLTHDQSMETQAFPQFYSYTVTQQEEDQDGNKHGYTTSLETNCSNPNGSELTNTHGHELNHASLSDPNMALVAFTNEKIMTVPTGLDDRSTSIHGLMLSVGVVVLLFGAIVALKRRINAI